MDWSRRWQAGQKPQTLVDILGDVDINSLNNKLAEKLPQVKTGIHGDTLRNVEAEALADELAQKQADLVRHCSRFYVKDQLARRSNNLHNPLEDVVYEALVKRPVHMPLEDEAKTYDDKVYDVKESTLVQTLVDTLAEAEKETLVM